MVFVQTIEENTTRAKITLIHNNPEVLTETELSTGITLDSLIEPVEESGKIKTIYINPQDTTQQWVEDSIAPLSQEAKIALLEEQNAAMLLALVLNDIMI